MPFLGTAPWVSLLSQSVWLDGTSHLQIPKSAHESVLPTYIFSYMHMCRGTGFNKRQAEPGRISETKSWWQCLSPLVSWPWHQILLGFEIIVENLWIAEGSQPARKGAKVHFVGLGASQHLPRERAILLLLLFSLLFSHKGLSSHILTQESLFLLRWLSGLCSFAVTYEPINLPSLFKSVWGLPLSLETQLTLLHQVKGFLKLG